MRPSRIVVRGESSVLDPLVQRLTASGLAIERANADPRWGDAALQIDDAWLALSDGRTATIRAHAANVRDLVLCDLALDFASTTRLAIAAADGCSDASYRAVVGALQAAGIAVSRFDDVAGLAVLRTVVMLANEAADAVAQGVGLPADIDLAMQRGVNYPRGPLAWADALGVQTIGAVLANLAAHYGEDRYRASPLIARRAVLGGSLHG